MAAFAAILATFEVVVSCLSRCGCVQITAKDKQIKQSAEKMKKLMAMVAQLKKQHQAEIEKLKLKAA